MALTLHWLSSLILWSLIVSVTAALSGRLKRRYQRIALITFVASLPLLLTSYIIYRLHTIYPTWVLENLPIDKLLSTHIISWTITYIIITSIIIIKAERTTHDKIASKGWSAGTLAIVLVLITALNIFVKLFADKLIVYRLEEVKEEALLAEKRLNPPPGAGVPNAAPLYEEAEVEFEDLPQWVKNINNESIDDTPPREDIENFLKEKEAPLRLLKKASSMNLYYQPVEMDDISSLPTYFGIMRATKALALRATLAAEDGNQSKALDDIEIIRSISKHLITNPTLISALSAINIHRRHTKSLEYILSATPCINSAEAAKFIEDGDYLLESMQRSLEFEQYFMSNYIALTYLSSPESGIRIYFATDDINFMNNYKAQIEGLTGMPYHTIKDEIEKWDDSSNDKLGDFFASVAYPEFSGYYIRSAKAQAFQELSNIALAIKLYESEHGEYPEDINKLTGKYLDEIPADPFDGKTLRVSRENEKIILYSVGEDAVDDNGKNDDLTFTLSKACKT